jgi:Thiamine pyrophosphate enzyme, C-terminal TPP binding domain
MPRWSSCRILVPSPGIALPGAIVAKVVRPDRKIIAVCGDGGILMRSSRKRPLAFHDEWTLNPENILRRGKALAYTLDTQDSSSLRRWRQVLLSWPWPHHDHGAGGVAVEISCCPPQHDIQNASFTVAADDQQVDP